AGIVVVMENALLDDVAAAFDFHPVITGAINLKALEMPKMSVGFQIKGSVSVGIEHRGKVQQRMFIGVGPNLAPRVGGAGIGYDNGMGISVCAASNPNDISSRREWNRSRNFEKR